MDKLSLRWAQFMVWYGPRISTWGRRIIVIVTVMVSVWAVADMARAVYHTSVLLVRVLPVRSAQLAQGYEWSHAAFAPQTLQVSTVDVVANPIAGVNAVADLTNANPNWIAHARVHFVSDQGQSPTQEVAVLPGKAQPVLAVGLPSGGRSSSVSAIVEGITWTPLPAAEQSVASSTGGIILQTPQTQTVDSVSIIHFVSLNATAHYYRDLRMLLRWYEGTRLAGFHVFTIDQIASRQRVTTDVSVPGTIATYARFQLDPLFDLTDPEHFFTPAPAARNALP